ncbi:unnamed protein product, partial [Laminaria digitata]
KGRASKVCIRFLYVPTVVRLASFLIATVVVAAAAAASCFIFKSKTSFINSSPIQRCSEVCCPLKLGYTASVTQREFQVYVPKSLGCSCEGGKYCAHVFGGSFLGTSVGYVLHYYGGKNSSNQGQIGYSLCTGEIIVCGVHRGL